MLLADERAAVVATCRQLVADGLVVGTAGNVSARAGDLIAVTPTGVAYDRLAPEQVAVYRLSGEPVDAPLPPTSELMLHFAAYWATNAGAVVHTHPVAATALSCVVDEVPRVHYYLAMFGGSVPVAPYAPYGTRELADATAAALRGRTACLLANHGAVTVGADLAAAHQEARYLEWLCDVALRVLSSGYPPALLTERQVAEVAPRIAAYRAGAQAAPGPQGAPGASGPQGAQP
jgi:L-fuculose-phosphate aldolase